MSNLSKRILINFKALAVVFIFIASCNKDNITIDECCENFGPPESYIGYTYTYDANMYGYPRFSPYDTNEFIYLKLYNDEQGDLYKFNRSNSSSQLLASNISHSPNWSRRDWIAFIVVNKIWIIKSNGDSLQNIFPEHSNYYPTWSPNGTILLFETQYENSTMAYFGDLNSTLIDSLDVAFSNGAWSPDSIKVATPLVINEVFGIYYIDLTDKNIYKIIETGYTDGDSQIKGIDWIPDSQNIIWADGNGVYITNINSHSTTGVICNCDAIEYIHPSVSYDGTKLLLEKITRSKPSENVIFEDHSIVLMNIDGTDEVAILE